MKTTFGSEPPTGEAKIFDLRQHSFANSKINILRVRRTPQAAPMGVLDRLGKRAPSGESLSGNIFNWRACPRYNKLLLLPRLVIIFKPLVPNPP